MALESSEWREFWEESRVPLYTFADLNLPEDLPDDALWRFCQERQLLLLTANRNADGPHSLEATLRTANTLESLPVFTIGDADLFINSKEYVGRVVIKLLDCLGSIDNYRGAGRLYLP
jgi:hypothetical protein